MATRRSDKDDHGYFPFRNLGKKLRQQAEKAEKKRPTDAREPSTRQATPEPIDDAALFEQAMAGVIPLSKSRQVERRSVPAVEQKSVSENPEKDAVLESLRQLVAKGTGFQVSATPEYVQGTNHGIHAELAQQLHRGHFSVQAHIDLHGMTIPEAQSHLDLFLHQAIARGERCLLVVHGRGLCSPGPPVLKNLVHQMCTSGSWRKWVLAFASARGVDGGAGATYVLLRKRPKSGQRQPKKSG